MSQLMTINKHNVTLHQYLIKNVIKRKYANDQLNVPGKKIQ